MRSLATQVPAEHRYAVARNAVTLLWNDNKLADAATG